MRSRGPGKVLGSGVPLCVALQRGQQAEPLKRSLLCQVSENIAFIDIM